MSKDSIPFNVAIREYYDNLTEEKKEEFNKTIIKMFNKADFELPDRKESYKNG